MIESLLAEASADGWLLNQLYQLDDGTFRCNFRREWTFTAIGEGESLEAALLAAVNLLSETTTVPLKPASHSIAPDWRSRLRKPTIERRI